MGAHAYFLFLRIASKKMTTSRPIAIQLATRAYCSSTVSYTHLTLPTIYSV